MILLKVKLHRERFITNPGGVLIKAVALGGVVWLFALP